MSVTIPTSSGDSRGMLVNSEAIVIIVSYTFCLLLMCLAVSALKLKNSDDFIIGGRRMGIGLVALSLSADNIGGASTSGVAGFAFSTGSAAVVWYVLACALAMIPLAFFAPRIRRTLAVTVPEVIRRRYGKSSALFTAALNIISSVCLISSQISAAGIVIHAVTGMNLKLAMVITTVVICFYTALGGMVADQFTDAIQYIMIIFGLAVAVPYVITGCGGWESVSASLPEDYGDLAKTGWVTIISSVLNYFCTFVTGPEMTSRLESARDEKTAWKASLLSGLLMAAVVAFPTVLGLCAYSVKESLGSINESGVLIAVTSEFAPGVIAGLLAAAVIAAAMSSADSYLLCTAAIAVKDIRIPLSKKKPSEKEIIRETRILIVFFSLVSLAVAVFNFSILQVNTFAFALRSAGPFAAYGLGLVVKKATRHSGQLSLITGTAGAVVWQLLSMDGFFLGILPSVFGAAAGILTFFIVNAVEWKKGIEPAPSAYISGDIR